MHARMPNRSELAHGRPAPQEWARIDPTIYVTAARRLQARATTEAIGVAWRGIRRGLTGLAGLARRHLLEPLSSWRSVGASRPSGRPPARRRAAPGSSHHRQLQSTARAGAPGPASRPGGVSDR
jgi:hypothetical protein